MRSIKLYTFSAVALTAVAFGGASASAANWGPVNTTVAGSGALTITTNSLGTVTCVLTISMRSTGNDLATSTAPPVFDNCSSNIMNPTVVTSSTNWTLTATSTTAVDLTQNFTINESSGLCVMTESGPVANNTWSNTAHTLTYNSAGSWPITEHGFCDGGTSGHMSGTVTFASNVIIT